MPAKWKRILSALFLTLNLFGCSAQTQEDSAKVELYVSAAASLTDALNELKESYAKEHPEVTITYNFGSSGKLAQQIEQGAPADLFLSASKKDMDTLGKKSLIADNTRIDFAKNELVLIANRNGGLQISSFDKIPVDTLHHIAIGEPESVPAGRYAKETLQTLKLWDQLQNKLVMGSDVRQVLAFVDSGNADLGIVYASDAKVSQNSKVLATAKPEWHQPIVYPAAVTASSAHAKEGKQFLDFLVSPKGKEILQKHGFQ